MVLSEILPSGGGGGESETVYEGRDEINWII